MTGCRAAVAFGAVALAALGLVAVHSADGDDNSDQTAAGYVNAYRATLGLPPLAPDAGLVADARRWVEHIADAGALSHDALDLDGWDTMGENVGRGASAEVVERAYEGSPPHEHNLAGAYTNLGVAVAARGDLVYTVQRFAGHAPVPPIPNDDARAAAAGHDDGDDRPRRAVPKGSPLMVLAEDLLAGHGILWLLLLILVVLGIIYLIRRL